MKKLNNIILGGLILGITAPSLVSCIDEAQPMNGIVTEKQIQKSSLAAEAVVNGLPTYAKRVWRSMHWAWGYPALMRIRDVMTGDYYVHDHDYNQFEVFARNLYAGPSYLITQFYYNYYYDFIFAANSAVRAVDPKTANDVQLGYLGVSYAYRAMLYLDVARMFEFLPCKVKDKKYFEEGKNLDGNTIKYLTVPIVTDKTSDLGSRKNPRATHEQMFKFIENDLNQAEKYIVHSANNKGNILPNLAVVYGLKARLYLWNAGYFTKEEGNENKAQANENYAKAKEYAIKAIEKSKDANITPIDKESALNPKTGFNDISKFMWGIKYDKEDGAIKTGLLNWTSFSSNETNFGYAQAGPQNMIARSLYDRISNSDWRKLMWKAPNDEVALGKNNIYVDGSERAYNFYRADYLKRKAKQVADGTVKFTPEEQSEYDAVLKADKEEEEKIKAMTEDDRKKYLAAKKDASIARSNSFLYRLPVYGSLKFRPNEGEAGINSPLVGAVTSVPLMRVEEMYFIEFEAAEHLKAGDGIVLLTKFMKEYRDPDYSYKGDNNIDEIIFQKRVELWGEGQSYFDYKRLNMSVKRSYPGTNFDDPQGIFNTDGRPAWMNICLVNLEENDNPAVKGWNNPDPTKAYEPVKTK